MSRLIATFFYIGLLPKAPGTWGSLAALPFAIMLHNWGGFTALFSATVIVFFVGWWATIQETAGQEDHDPGEIVIDEVAGQWITLLPASYLFTRHDLPLIWPALIAGFIFFRLFDILKPWPISWADKKSTAFGVMLDDILAGIFAAIAVVLLAGIYHGVTV